MSPSRSSISTGTPDQGSNGLLERNTFLLMVMTLLSRLLGLVRIRIMSSLLGASALGDILLFTLNIPNNIRKLLAEGALSSAYVPEYSAFHHEDPQKAGSFFLLVLKILFASSALLAVFFALFGEQLLLAISGFEPRIIRDAGVLLLVIFSIYSAGIILTTLAANTLHVHRRFFIPSLAPIILSSAVITFSVVFFPLWGVYSIAWGFALGGLIPAVLMTPLVRRISSLRAVKVSSSGFLRRWGLLAVIAAAFFIDQQVAFYLASTLEEGSVIIFSNAIVIWQMPFGVFFTSIITALYPEISKAYSRQETGKIKKHMGRGVVHVCIFLIPSSVLLYIFSLEISSLILLSGNYTMSSVEKTAVLLRFFAPGLLMLGITQLFMRELYIRKAWRTAGFRTALFTVLDIILSVTLIRTPLGLSGLPAAFTISYTVTALISLVGSSIGMDSLRTCLHVIGINIVFAVFLVLLKLTVAPWGSSWFIQALHMAVLAFAGIVVLVFLYNKIGVSFFSLLLKKETPSD